MVSPNEIVASVDYENIDGFRIRMGCVTVGTEGVPQPFEPTHYVRRDVHRNEIGELQKRIELLESRVAKADALLNAIEATMIAEDISQPVLLAMINYDNDCILRTQRMGKVEIMKKHADAMLKVEAGYTYSPDLAEELYFNIKKLEEDLQKQIGYKNDYKAVYEELWSEQKTIREDILMEVANIARKHIYHDSVGTGFDEEGFEADIFAIIKKETS